MAEITRFAQLSEDGVYRWLLGRQWSFKEPVTTERLVCWIMLNPSTADAEMDDPTIRRCISFSQAWGYDGLTVVNAYAPLLAAPDDCAVVLDPFMGSGTTLRAAADCGRRAIGIERDERYCEVAVRRLAQTAADFGGVT